MEAVSFDWLLTGLTNDLLPVQSQRDPVFIHSKTFSLWKREVGTR